MTFEDFHELVMRVCPPGLVGSINKIRVREGQYRVDLDAPHDDIAIASWMPDSNVEATLRRAFAKAVSP